MKLLFYEVALCSLSSHDLPFHLYYLCTVPVCFGFKPSSDRRLLLSAAWRDWGQPLKTLQCKLFKPEAVAVNLPMIQQLHGLFLTPDTVSSQADVLWAVYVKLKF